MLLEDVAFLEDAEVSEIGRKVKALREAKPWSQRKLGKLAHTSGPYISQLESGQTPKPGAIMLQQIADALGVAIQVTSPGGYTFHPSFHCDIMPLKFRHRTENEAHEELELKIGEMGIDPPMMMSPTDPPA